MLYFFNNSISFQELPVNDHDTLAIKVFTNLGPLIINTLYIPPHIKTLPIIAYNKILNCNLPTLIIADFNSHHLF